MRRFSFLISRYVFQAVLPYFIFTWMLLSVILFVQQASRYSDLLFDTNLPNYLIFQLTIALVPNVLAFTCPVAVLVSVIIGLSRMQGDSEMVSIRAAGIGNLQITIPVILLGLLLSFFALFINIKGVPFAAQIVRQVALKAALYKLESPIDPGVFNSEINDLTIFVKNGNIEKGTWENIFIYQKDKNNGQVRLITSKEGRIDSTGENSEIVLQNASVTTLNPNEETKIISEKVDDFRLIIKTKRGELIEKLARSKETPEEMGLAELATFIKTLEGQEKIEAQILWQRRILLSITPLIFALLGTALVTKYNRGGRGFGVFLSLLSLVFYYLLTLLSEQLARIGSIQVFTAFLIPVLISLTLIVWLYISRRLFISRSFSILSYITPNKNKPKSKKNVSRTSKFGFSTSILDLDIILSLLKNYLLTFGFLTSIYLIFTAFELWKFAGTIDNGIVLLLTYLVFLIPFIYIQLSPSALMIATIATYVIKSRQNEVVTWTAAGMSVYRLLLPCFLLMIIIGGINFGLQETILTDANRIQDTLRDRIRNRNITKNDQGKMWVAENNKIYTFEKVSASDNVGVEIKDLQIFEFNEEYTKIVSSIIVKRAVWKNGKINFTDKAEKITWENGIARKSKINNYELIEENNPFQESITKPNHLDIRELKSKIENADNESEKRNYLISLQKKYTTLFIPFIIVLFTVPFSLSIGRRRNVITIGYAIGVWLLFMGVTNTLEQFGQSGFLHPAIAIWSPLVLFTIIGMYFLAKVRT